MLNRALVVVLMLVLAAVPGMAAQQGWYVNHETKQCVPYVGIGLGQPWVLADSCPDGYELPRPEPEPWYLRLLRLLDSWFGLSSKVVWLPSAKTLAGIAGFVLLLRRFLQVFGGVLDKLTHGVGTIVLSTLVTALTYVQPMLADGKLTAYEALLALLTAVAGAAGFWEVTKRLVRARR